MKLTELSDEELMALASNGNLEAMEYLFDRYQKRIFNFLYQMSGDYTDSQDLTQNVFYKLIRNKKSYKGGQFSSWIFRITRNLFYDYIADKRKSKISNNIENYDYYEMIDESEADNRRQQLNIYKILNELKVEEKELILMCKSNGMRYQEIAVIMNSNPSAIKMKVYRIMKKIRKNLKGTS